MTVTAQAAGREFRRDINGLRAWAVMAVVLYHFGVPGITGGFAGVDVFFVISGYLMCGIIFGGLERRDFSVWRFYLARARRIFPALIALSLVALVFGWFFLMPEEYKHLGKHVRESLTFSSNLRYFKESGYFDVASQEKWLLHTWSLSVEWQFYLLLPLVLMLVAKLSPGRRAVTLVLGALFALSLGACLWRTAVAPSEAFYMIQSRAWEMLAGALVFLAGRRELSPGMRRLWELAGFGLILAAILLLDKRSVWPGWHAIVPVAGAALVLLAARERSVWTGSAVAQWLGTRSYSIYLWHWPLVVALAYVERLDDSLWIAVAVPASLLLGHLSYLLVEVPASRRTGLMPAGRAGIVLVVALVVSATVAQQVRRSGFPVRLPEAVAAIEAERENDNPRLEKCLDPAASCIYGDGPVRAILIGDSHADAVATAVQAALPSGPGGILFRGGSGCLIAFGMQSEDRPACAQLNATLEKEHAAFPVGAPIIMMGRTSEYVHGGLLSDAKPVFHFDKPAERIDADFLQQFREHYVATMCSLAQYRPVYIVRPTPEMGVDVPTLMGRSLLLGGRGRQFSLSLADYQNRHAFVRSVQDEAAERCGVHLLDPQPYLCTDSQCPSVFDGHPIYRDSDHLTERGNRLLVPMFREIFATTVAHSD